VDVSIEQEGQFVIGKVDSVTLSKVRSARQDASTVPISALGSLPIPNLIASGKVSIGVKEDQCDKISNIVIKVNTLPSSDEWELNDVTLSLHSYTDSLTSF